MSSCKNCYTWEAKFGFGTPDQCWTVWLILTTILLLCCICPWFLRAYFPLLRLCRGRRGRGQTSISVDVPDAGPSGRGSRSAAVSPDTSGLEMQVSKLKALSQMHKEGTLSQAEFDKKKNEILADFDGDGIPDSAQCVGGR